MISAARPGVLSATHFKSSGRKLTLVFEHRLIDLVADRVGGRFKQLARPLLAFGLDRPLASPFMGTPPAAFSLPSAIRLVILWC